MTNLIDTLLNAARLEGGNITPELKEVNMNELVEELTGELQSLAKDARLTPEINVPENVRSIKTDPILLNVIMQNFFSNAVKYSEEGKSIMFMVKEDGKDLIFSVKDFGLGIPEKDQARIFERLYRATNVREVDTTGSGLGLFISKMIAKSLGGEIVFKSKENKGSEFILRLPIN